MMKMGKVSKGLVARDGALRVRETNWGFIIQKGKAARRRAEWGELAATMGCVFFAFAAYIQWAWPGNFTGVEMLPFRVSGTVFFALISAVLYLIMRRGLSVEMQIDTEREQVRLMRSNRVGRTTRLGLIRFCDIRSIYTRRSKTHIIADQLYIRSRTGKAPVLVASGPPSELEPLLDRLQSALRGRGSRPAGRNEIIRRAKPPVRVRGAFATS